MSTQSESQNKKFNHRPIGLDTRKAWFLKGDLVSIHHENGAMGVTTIRNWTQDRLETMPTKDFRRLRRRAFSSKEASLLLGRERSYLARRAKMGWWKPPTGRLPGGERLYNGPSYYSEEDLYEIREIMAGIHIGAPRRDGLVTNNVITEAELRAAINDDYYVTVIDQNGETATMIRT